MNTINMLSKADMTKGHGVLSAHDEQVQLVKEVMGKDWKILENSKKFGDITHYHTINPEYYLSIPFAKRAGSTVGYVHFLPETVENSIQMPRLFKKIFYWYMLKFYKKMDYLVTVNPYFIEKLEAYGVPKEKVYYIPNFVSDKQFYPIEKEKKKEIRAKYGLENKFTVLCVGQLQKRKGIFEYVKIAKKMPDVQFTWAGDFSFGKITDGYNKIKEMMKTKPDNLHFLGMIDREDMNEVYNMADVMFLPSFEELFPMTILESMNCKIPILVRDLEIYNPILFDYALRGNDNQEFIQILERLRWDKDYYDEAAQHAFDGHIRYSRETIGKMWEAYYSHIACCRKSETYHRKGKKSEWKQKEEASRQY